MTVDDQDIRNTDAVVACADLVGRCGATAFRIGYLHEGVPSELAGWYAQAEYRGARIMIEDQESPHDAAVLLAKRLLRGGACRCGRKVILGPMARPDRCLWQLNGRRWEPGCQAPPMEMPGSARGDHGMLTALAAAHRLRRQGGGRA